MTATALHSFKSAGIKKPIVLFFGVPEFIFAQSIRDLKSSPFDFVQVKDFSQVEQAFNSGRFKVGVLFDQGAKDPASLIEISKKMGDSRWIHCARDFSHFAKINVQALKDVDYVLEYPILTSKLISKIKFFGDEGYRTLNFPLLAKADAPKLTPAVFPNPILGLERIVETKGYQNRRKWVPLSKQLFRDVAPSASKLKEVIHESLKKVFKDLSELGRLSVVSFGVDSPYLGEKPDQFVILSTSEHLTGSIYNKTFACNSYPELLEAARLKSPVFAPDVRGVPAFRGVLSQIERSGARSLVAIPLIRGNRPFAMIKARLPFVQDKATLNLISDLSSYSKELSPFVSHYDFFNRIYRSIKK